MMKVSEGVRFLQGEDPRGDLSILVRDGDESRQFEVKMISPVTGVNYVAIDAGRVIDADNADPDTMEVGGALTVLREEDQDDELEAFVDDGTYSAYYEVKSIALASDSTRWVVIEAGDVIQAGDSMEPPLGSRVEVISTHDEVVATGVYAGQGITHDYGIGINGARPSSPVVRVRVDDAALRDVVGDPWELNPASVRFVDDKHAPEQNVEVILKCVMDAEDARRLGNMLDECHRGTEEVGMGLMFMPEDSNLTGIKVITWEMDPSPFGR